jgi:hypothetical protein
MSKFLRIHLSGNILSHLRQAQTTLLQQTNRLHFELLGVRPTRLSHTSTTPLPPNPAEPEPNKSRKEG